MVEDGDLSVNFFQKWYLLMNTNYIFWSDPSSVQKDCLENRNMKIIWLNMMHMMVSTKKLRILTIWLLASLKIITKIFPSRHFWVSFVVIPYFLGYNFFLGYKFLNEVCHGKYEFATFTDDDTFIDWSRLNEYMELEDTSQPKAYWIGVTYDFSIMMALLRLLRLKTWEILKFEMTLTPRKFEREKNWVGISSLQW